MAIHPSVGPVTSIRVAITRAGVTSQHNADLIHVGGVPHVVIEWSVVADGDRPLVTVPLDPRWVKPLGWQAAAFLYEFPIQDPRRLN